MDAAVACQWLLWLCRHYVHDRVQIDLTEEGGVLKALSITRTPTFTNLNVTLVLSVSYSTSNSGKACIPAANCSVHCQIQNTASQKRDKKAWGDWLVWRILVSLFKTR